MKKSERTRQYIIEQCAPVFNAKGYAATSIGDIMRQTGLTKGGIYGNFASKDEMALLAFEHNAQIVMRQLREKIREQPTAPLKLNAMLDFFGTYVSNPPVEGGCPILNTAVEADDLYPELRQHVVNAFALLRQSVEKILARGIEFGQIKPNADVRVFAVTFLAILEGAIVMGRVSNDEGLLHTAIGRVRRMIDEELVKKENR
ncbi:MAG: TetR/AcrR family transcriptional regulator [Calditrichaeota bacterium]|nr:TetR/AcrR family transcriptional regulator [Calditrichota bacterium]